MKQPHIYTGYPMVRQARAMVEGGQIGTVRLVQVEYVQGGRAIVGPGRKAWKEDPARGGPSLVMGDIGRMRTTCCVSSPGWKWQRWPPRWAASCQDESHMTLLAPC